LSAQFLCQLSSSRDLRSAPEASCSCIGTRMSKIVCSESPTGFHPPWTHDTGRTSTMRPVTRASGISFTVAKDRPAEFWQRMVNSCFTMGATDLVWSSGFGLSVQNKSKQNKQNCARPAGLRVGFSGELGRAAQT